MSQKKGFRSDNTYLIVADTGDNPKLGAKVLSNGRESLFLDYYFGYTKVYDEVKDKEVVRVERKREYLSLYLWQAPRNPQERQHNKETLELAKKIRYERGQELLESVEGYRLKRKHSDINFLDYFQAYIKSYSKKDKRMIESAYKRFADFLKETPEYNKYMKHIKPEQITKDMVMDFTDYLKSKGVGEGAKSYYARFKKVIKHAVEHDVMDKNPCTGVVIKYDEQLLRKEVLSQEEIQTLMETPYNANPSVKRAFILCLYCGLRFCDVKDLTFANVDYSNRLLKFEQNKTKGHSANSGVVIPLNDGLLNLIGKPQREQDREKVIFPLPSYTACIKDLRQWVKNAGINKHISWHCARHSFAVNILNNGANIKTVASLLGHSGLRHTEKYTRAIDSLKQEAINSLPELKL